MTRTALEPLQTNCVKVWIGDKTVLFSYNVPIGAWIRGEGKIKRYALKQLPSPTSARHLNKYMDLREGDDAIIRVSAEELDDLLSPREE